MSEVMKVKALCDVDLMERHKSGEVKEYPAELAKLLISLGLVAPVKATRQTTKGTK